jgi:hypothetical protein
MKLTTHLHVIPRLRMREAIPPRPLYIFMMWYLVKHTENFTFYFSCRKLLESHYRPLGSKLEVRDLGDLNNAVIKKKMFSLLRTVCQKYKMDRQCNRSIN